MALKITKPAAATAVAAAFCLLATPVAAVDLPRPAAAKAYDGEALDAERDRRRRWRGDDDIDAGDVIAGVLVLGAIAAIAGAGKSNRDRDRYEERYPIPEDDAGYRTQGVARDDLGRTDSRGLGNAVDICLGEVERDQGRVGSVDAASRSVDGWHVSGVLESGAPFACRIGNDGRISGVEVGAYEAGYGAPEDGEWSDDAYTQARENEGYPGDDGRYETAETTGSE